MCSSPTRFICLVFFLVFFSYSCENQLGLRLDPARAALCRHWPGVGERELFTDGHVGVGDSERGGEGEEEGEGRQARRKTRRRKPLFALPGAAAGGTRRSGEEELDSPESLIGTEQRSYFAQKEIAGAAAVSEEIEVE